jgi:hypothetical protein
MSPSTGTVVDAVLGDLFDDAAKLYFEAVDAERWDLVWGLADLIDAIHALAEGVA